MNVRVYSTWAELETVVCDRPDVFTPPPLAPGAIPVVIDVLRATSTIVSAIEAGATEIVPVESVEEAFAWRTRDPLAVLGGERVAAKVAGFDLGNSPREYLPATVGGRRVVFTTTNGTRALACAHRVARLTAEADVATDAAGGVLCASFLNLDAVVERLQQLRRDVLVVCAGTYGCLSADDLLVAGAIVSLLADGPGGNRADLAPGGAADRRRMGGEDRTTWDVDGDLSAVAEAWYRRHAFDLARGLAATVHARALERLGHGEDVAFCGRRGVSATVPVYDGETIRSR